MTLGKSAHLSLCSAASWNHPVNAVVLRVLSESPCISPWDHHTHPKTPVAISNLTHSTCFQFRSALWSSRHFSSKASQIPCVQNRIQHLSLQITPLFPYLSMWHQHIPFPQKTQNSPRFLCPSQPITKHCPYSLTSSVYESSYSSIAIVTLQHPFIGLSLNPCDKVTQEIGGRAGIGTQDYLSP